MKVHLRCEDFGGECCGSCHEDYEEFGYEMIYYEGDYDTPPNAHGRHPKVVAHVCCHRVAADVMGDREKLAAVLRARRARLRQLAGG